MAKRTFNPPLAPNLPEPAHEQVRRTHAAKIIELQKAVEDLSASTAATSVALFTRTTPGTVPAPGGSGTTRFLCEDASWSAPSSAVAGSLAIAVAFVGDNTTHATVTLSEGDLDWFAPLAIPGNTSGYADHFLTPGTVHHTKLDGGRWCFLGTSAIWNQGGAFAIFNTIKRNSTSADDADGSLTNDNTIPYLTPSAAGCGWKIVVPATTATQVLRVYIGHFSANITAYARLTDNSAASVSVNSNTGSGNAQEDKFTVTFNSATNGVYLVCKVLINQLFSGGNIGLGAVTLATV